MEFQFKVFSVPLNACIVRYDLTELKDIFLAYCPVQGYVYTLQSCLPITDVEWEFGIGNIHYGTKQLRTA